MSKWKKKEEPVSIVIDVTESEDTVQETPVEEAPEQETPTQTAPKQKASKKKAPKQEPPAQETPVEEPPAQETAEQAPPAAENKGEPAHRASKRRGMAFLGFVTIAFALFGVVSMFIFIAQNVQARRAEQLDEVAYVLSSLTACSPTAFEDVNNTEQDAILLSALYHVTVQEQIRQERENDMECRYEMDDLGRMLVPVKEVEKAYAFLFGPDAVPYHHTIGEEGLSYTYSYDKENNVYHLPQDAGESFYDIVYDDMSVWFGTVTVKVGYVSGWRKYDAHGNRIAPTLEDAEIVQEYTLQEYEDSYYIVSMSDVV